MNIDKLNNAPRSQVQQAAFATIQHLQDEPVETQAAALSSAFLLLAQHLGVRPQQLWTVASNIIHDADQKMRPEFAAIRDYMAEELQ